VKILITGGCGFVGTQLLRILPKEYRITVLDNLMGYAGTFPDKALPDTVHFIHGDIRDKLLMDNLVPQYDIVVHLAGIVGFPACRVNLDVSTDVNIRGTENVVNPLTRSQKLIFISTFTLYGKQTSEVVDEASNIKPLTEYAEHKAAGELIVKKATCPWIILRPATAFGASDRIRLDLLPNTLIYEALVNKNIEVFQPNVMRPFIHVIDFARALLHCIEGNTSKNTIYNIANPALNIRKIELVQFIAENTDSKYTEIKGTDPDERDYWLSSEKFSKTGFTYLPNTLFLGIQQLKERLALFEGKFEEFSSPYQFEKYLRM
jgi:nucleoside-diphosphate-sugar epimerase